MQKINECMRKILKVSLFFLYFCAFLPFLSCFPLFEKLHPCIVGFETCPTLSKKTLDISSATAQVAPDLLKAHSVSLSSNPPSKPQPNNFFCPPGTEQLNKLPQVRSFCHVKHI